MAGPPRHGQRDRDHRRLPRQLPGSPLTCHELQSTDAYRALRTRLEQFASGTLAAAALFPAPCDAVEIMP